MAVTITPKRGDSDPGTDDLADGEIAIRKDVNPPKLFVRVGSNIREIGAGEANQSLTTGNGLTGANSGDSGDFTIAVGAGTGIDVAADAISVDVSDFMTNGSNNRVLTATGTDAMNAEANLTFDGSDLALANNSKVIFGDAGEHIVGDGTDLDIKSSNDMSFTAGDDFDFQCSQEASDSSFAFNIRGDSGDDIFFRVTPDALRTELRYNGSQTNYFRTQLAANGETTLSTADSDGTAGHFTLDIDGNITLDADGGTITFSDNGSSLGTITSSGYSGNAATATTLATARNIGGVSFNGSANINLPGVNTSGNQDTTGNAATATALATARNIAGQSFDGTGDISIAPTDLTSVTATASEINVLDGFAGATADLTYAKDLRATGVTTTEFDKLDGLTASTSELNIMDGVTASTSELNIMDGVTASTAELNIMDGVTATTAELNLIDGGTARGTTAVASGDGFLHNDGGTMRMTNISKLADRLAGSGLSASDGVLSSSASTGLLSFNDQTMSGNGIILDSAADITLDADGEDIFLKDGGTTFGTLKNFNTGLGILGGTATSQYTIVTDSSGNLTTGTNFPFVIAAGMTNLGSSSAEKLLSFNTTNGNTISGTDPGDGFYNQTFTVPFDCKLVAAIGSFDKSITNSTNLGTFTLTKANSGSDNFADIFVVNEAVEDPHTPLTDWAIAGLGTAGTIYNFLNFSAASEGIGQPATGSFGPQSFSQGDKISGSMKVSSSVNTSIRGSWTFVFVSTGGLELASSE